MSNKPMLIEALKPGMRAKVPLIGYGQITVETSDDGGIIFDVASKSAIPNIDVLRSTDYEIIPADLVPWNPSAGDTGWVVGPSYGTHPQSYVGSGAFRTREGAEQAAKIMKVINAICNMPGYGGECACVHMSSGGVFLADSWPSSNYLKFNFDTMQHASGAAGYANKLMEDMQNA